LKVKHPKQAKTTTPKESVWDYPHSPKLVRSKKQITVKFNEKVIAHSKRACRLLESSHPPVYYIPQEDVNMEYLIPSTYRTYCEVKGIANYYHVKVGNRIVENACWYYPRPHKSFDKINNHLSFYAHLMQECTVNGELVKAQLGKFYGGWITNDIVGPFKGGPNPGRR